MTMTTKATMKDTTATTAAAVTWNTPHHNHNDNHDHHCIPPRSNMNSENENDTHVDQQRLLHLVSNPPKKRKIDSYDTTLTAQHATLTPTMTQCKQHQQQHIIDFLFQRSSILTSTGIHYCRRRRSVAYGGPTTTTSNAIGTVSQDTPVIPCGSRKDDIQFANTNKNNNNNNEDHNKIVSKPSTTKAAAVLSVVRSNNTTRREYRMTFLRLPW
jgi:hypothetical protein